MLCFVAIVFIPKESKANGKYGPLLSYAQSPIQTNSLTPQLRSGLPLTADDVQLYSSFTAASIWIDTPDYHADYYQNQLFVGSKWQANEKWQFDVNYRWGFAANNYLDGPTKSFHDWFGIDQNGRDEVDNHQFTLSMPKYGIDESNFKGDTITSAVSFYGQYQLLETEDYGLSIGSALFYNRVSSGAFKGNNLEQSLQLNYTYLLEKHSFFSSLGFNYRYNHDVIGDFPLDALSWTLIGGYQYQVFEKHQLHAEYRIYEGAEDGHSEFSRLVHEALLGYRYIMDQSALELSLVENMFNMDNSTDIAFTFGFRYKL
ncbi:DUF3187 family protein [Vibrio makurazakiensis]|uniref:DUF3187 family protein n=1 Tax=Vibrio makurazakiensis TaxID=2910250 RepID=UPI003D1493C0